MERQISILELKTFKGKAALIAAIFIAILFVSFGVKWQIGSMIAELTPPNQPNAKETANVAAAFAPGDPRAQLLVAASARDFLGEGREVDLYKRVALLSPYDFRWWIELGRAYERSEMPAAAELAFKRGVELAPAYSFPRWHIGNFYLRQNRTVEAFSELKRATENSVKYRDQVFSLAWDYFDKDPLQLEQLAADTPEVWASLALFYAYRGKPQDSLRVWNRLSDEEKAKKVAIARSSALALHERRFFRQSLAFANQSGDETGVNIGAFTDGGFERAIELPEETLYGWRITRTDGKVDFTVDSSIRREGLRSLRVSFRNHDKVNFHNISQLIAVEPLSRYRVSFWLRTENLNSGGPPIVEIVDATEFKGIAASASFPTGTTDWQEVLLEFTASEVVDGVIIRTSRSYCGDVCPLTGTFWLDDFKIDRF